MAYTISEAAARMGISPSALRYYDKEGLLPDIRRRNGVRVFEEKDFSWLTLLNCLKGTGMPLRRIRQYVELAKEGDATLQARYKLIRQQRQSVQEQIEQLQFFMTELDFKDWYYRKAIALGSEQAVPIDEYDGPLPQPLMSDGQRSEVTRPETEGRSE